MNFIGAHTDPASAFSGLRRSAAVHGLSDGSWGLCDGISELLRIVGKSHLVISTWTASNADTCIAPRRSCATNGSRVSG